MHGEANYEGLNDREDAMDLKTDLCEQSDDVLRPNSGKDIVMSDSHLNYFKLTRVSDVLGDVPTIGNYLLCLSIFPDCENDLGQR